MLRHTLAYFGIRVVNGVIGLTALYVMTRLLPPEQYGVYALGMAAISVAASVLFQGLAVATARFYPEHAADPAALLAASRRSFLMLATVALVLACVGGTLRLHPDVDWGLVAAVAAGAVLMGLHNLNLQLANVQGLPRRYGALTACRAAVTLLVAVALVMAGWGALGALMGIAAGCLVAIGLLGVERVIGVAGAPTTQSTRTLRRQIIAYATPLTATYAATMLLDVSDRFLIGWWYGPAKVAGYAAGYDLVQQSIGALLNVLFLAGFPRVLAAWQTDGAVGAKTAMAPLLNAFALAIPLVVGLVVAFAAEIATGMLGPALRDEAAVVIPWIAAAVALLCFKGYVLDVAFQVSKATQLQLGTTLLMAVVNVVCNLALLPTLGLVGSAMSATIAVSAGLVASLVYGRRTDIYPPLLLPAVQATLATLVVVFASRGVALMVDAWSTPWGLMARLMAAMACFAVIALALNLGGIRQWSLWQRMVPRRENA
jgi:O-antigen/teichoic acid export membrane protein